MGESDKVKYVRSAKQTRHHTCHWPGCTTAVPPAMWGCQLHWYKLPGRLRKLIWHHYRPGQEITMNPTTEYIKVAEEVQKYIQEKLLGKN